MSAAKVRYGFTAESTERYSNRPGALIRSAVVRFWKPQSAKTGSQTGQGVEVFHDPADGLHADGAGDLQVVALGHELVLAALVGLSGPERDVVVAAVGRHAHERLGHEAREGSHLTADLLADLAVGGEPVGRQVGPVEVEVELQLARGVLVVALDHVQAHGLAVLDHPVDERLEFGELVDVVAVRLGHALHGGLAIGVGLEPHHLGLGPGTQMEAGLLFEGRMDAL